MSHSKLSRIARVSILFTFCLAMLAAIDQAAHGAPGQLDPTFNGAGTRVFPEATSLIYANGIAVQSDGRILVAGYNNDFVYRLLPNGELDSTFGGTGRLSLNSINTHRVIVQADGRIVTVGGSGSIDLLRFNAADGSRDTSFGGNGKVATTFGLAGITWGYTVAQQPDGKLVAAGTAGYSVSPFRAQIALFRVNPDGTPDATFGTGGQTVVNHSSGYFAMSSMLLLPNGQIVVGGNASPALDSEEERWALARFNPNGTLDPTFGSGGFSIQSLGGTTEWISDIALAPDGKIVAVGYGNPFAAMMRFNIDGTPDQTFGVGGKLTFTDAGGSRAVVVQSDGKIVASVAYSKSFQVVRLFANGSPDPSFAFQSVSMSGSSAGFGQMIALQPDGKVVFGYAVANSGKYDLGVGRAQGDEILGTVVEFYNTNLKHYFVTANVFEQASIDAGGSGAGWMRTGLTFKSGGNSRACRFYGTPGVGPNSHFYTVEAAECGLVKLDPGWHFESYDFSSSPPTAPGTCPAGTVAVYRAYNKRFAFNDSNHRLTTSLAAYNSTVASGWSGEGVVMCAPA